MDVYVSLSRQQPRLQRRLGARNSAVGSDEDWIVGARHRQIKSHGSEITRGHSCWETWE